MNENKTFKALKYNKTFWHLNWNFHNKSKFGTRIRIGVGYFFLFADGIVFALPICTCIFFFKNVRDPSLSLISIHGIILLLHSFHV